MLPVQLESSRRALCFSMRTQLRVSSTAAAADVFDEDMERIQRPRLQHLRDRLHREGNTFVKVSKFKSTSEPRSQLAAPFVISTPMDDYKPSVLLPPSSFISIRDVLKDLPDPSLDQVLVDSFARRHSYLRLSLTERCNLRCTYCMPEQGVPLQPASHLLQTHELLSLASTFSRLGVTKFRLTGGEPTLRKDVVHVIAGLKRLQPKQIGMTSNGIKIPNLLDELIAAGLDSLNLSLDTLEPQKFAQLTRRPAKNLERVVEALGMAHAYAEALPRFTVKLNCVVMRGVNDEEVTEFCRLTERYPLLQVRFIEYMPFDENGWNQNLLVEYRELLDRLAADSVSLIPIESGDPHDTTKWFSVKDNPVSRIGFITSMSAHFCDSCNRLRLTADGQLKSCLFDGGEVSLTRALREGWDESELRKLVHWAVQRKPQALGGHSSPQDIHNDAGRNRPMTLIGG